MQESLSSRARQYATTTHEATNHRYGDHAYSYHLAMVAGAAERFLPTTNFNDAEKEQILAACWCHDIIEDARETYNDVKKVMGYEVAEIVYALTNEKGRNRAERANDKYYAGIKASDQACLTKMCDRIANMEHSQATSNRMLARYQKEFPEFKAKLYTPGKFEVVWKHLEELAESIS